MLARLSIVAGLVVGIAVAVVVFAGVVALTPDVPFPTVAAPSFALPSVPPTPVVASSAPSASASTSVPPSAEVLTVGQSAPALVVQHVGDGAIDLSNLPGVDVTP